MLTILGNPKSVCSGLTRRELLQAGGAGLLGLSVPRLMAIEQAIEQTRGQTARPLESGAARAKSVIFLFLFGGPSQLETFDMKPDAPSEIRGPFKAISSRTPGLALSEHLSRTAKITDKLCVIRSMTHPHNDHNACHYIQTGHAWTRSAASGGDVNSRDTDWPSMGSIVEYVSQHSDRARQRNLPDYISLPNRLGHLQGYDRTGQYAGWLGPAYSGLATDIQKRNAKDNPYFRDCTDDELDFGIKGLMTPLQMPLPRLNRRVSLLDQFEARRRLIDKLEPFTSFDRIREQATWLATSEEMRTALDIEKEPSALRDRYGRHLFGQSTLMARRLIEAGSRFVTVFWDTVDGYSWDSHRSSHHLGKHLIPGFDQAFSTLIADLEDRGLLDETLVVAVGEMGRTPKPNAAWGRGHWSYCFPAVLAGAGIRGGVIHGTSDAHAARPVDRPTSPEDLAATIYTALGIDPRRRIADAEGRPVEIVEGGRPLTELFS